MELRERKERVGALLCIQKWMILKGEGVVVDVTTILLGHREFCPKKLAKYQLLARPLL